MSHNYYEDELDFDNSQRLKYFDDQFISLANHLASQKGITLSVFLSDIRNITTFKAKLTEVFGLDNSLANYVEGMSNRSIHLFFKRPVIQNIVDLNLSKGPNKIPEEIPILVKQEEKNTIDYFKATIKEKKSGKVRKTIGKISRFKIRGKKTERLRDSKGRFVKKIAN